MTTLIGMLMIGAQKINKSVTSKMMHREPLQTPLLQRNHTTVKQIAHRALQPPSRTTRSATSQHRVHLNSPRLKEHRPYTCSRGQSPGMHKFPPNKKATYVHRATYHYPSITFSRTTLSTHCAPFVTEQRHRGNSAGNRGIRKRRRHR